MGTGKSRYSADRSKGRDAERAVRAGADGGAADAVRMLMVVVVKGARAKRSMRDRRAQERQQEGRESGGCGCAPGFDHDVWDVWLLVMMEVMMRRENRRQTPKIKMDGWRTESG